MKKLQLFLAFLVICLVSCDKDNDRSFEYWSNQVSEKYKQINELTQSVSCADIDDFELVNKNGYYLVHPSIKSNFDQLMLELERLNTEMYNAAGREGIMFDLTMEPNPPVRRLCKDGKATLIYAQDLSLSEVNTELADRYPKIQNFYADVPCTDPSAWTARFMRNGCCMEGIAVHNTIRTDEFLEQIFIYSSLSAIKLQLENVQCTGGCPNMAKPVACVNGKAVVELTSN